MPGPRQRLSVLEANGRKHLSKAEKAARAAQEVELPKPAKMRVPRWLPEHLKADFRALAKELLAADMGAAQLDRDPWALCGGSAPVHGGLPHGAGRPGSGGPGPGERMEPSPENLF